MSDENSQTPEQVQPWPTWPFLVALGVVIGGIVWWQIDKFLSRDDEGPFIRVTEVSVIHGKKPPISNDLWSTYTAIRFNYSTRGECLDDSKYFNTFNKNMCGLLDNCTRSSGKLSGCYHITELNDDFPNYWITKLVQEEKISGPYALIQDPTNQYRDTVVEHSDGWGDTKEERRRANLNFCQDIVRIARGNGMKAKCIE